MATIEVCKSCGEALGDCSDGKGNTVCGNPFCVEAPDHSVPIQVQIPDEVCCSDCGQAAIFRGGRWHIGNDKDPGISGFRNAQLDRLPFYSVRNQTFYCGCKGWK